MAKVDDDLAAAKAERDALKADRDQLNQDLRAAERALRNAQGDAGDAKRLLRQAEAQVEELALKVAEHQQGNLARDWQLEQQRELGRRMKQLAEQLTQPVIAIEPEMRSNSDGVPVDRGPMTDEERQLWQKQRDDQDIKASQYQGNPSGLTQAMADHYEELDQAEEAKRAAEGHR